MSIQENLKAAIKEAMLAKNKAVLQTLRMLSAAFKQIEIDKKIELTDDVLQAELVRQVKQRKDSLQQYKAAGRDDLAEVEEKEILIIQQFLPRQLTAEEMQSRVDALVSESGLPLEMASMGKLMGALKAELQGKADMAEVNKYLRQKIQSA